MESTDISDASTAKLLDLEPSEVNDTQYGSINAEESDESIEENTNKTNKTTRFMFMKGNMAICVALFVCCIILTLSMMFFSLAVYFTFFHTRHVATDIVKPQEGISADLMKSLDGMSLYELVIDGENEKEDSTPAFLLTYRDAGTDMLLFDEKNDRYVFGKKKEESFSEYAEYLEDDVQKVTCKCSAYCTVYEEENKMVDYYDESFLEGYAYEDEDDEFDQRRKFKLPFGIGVKEIFIWGIITFFISKAYDIGSGMYKSKKMKKAQEEFNELCKSQEVRDITCECDVDVEGCDGKTWECHAKCFNGIRVMYTYPRCMPQSKVQVKARVDMLKFCKKHENPEKRPFNPEIHDSYVVDNYVHCKK